MRKIDIEALCADKGLRITEQRRVIAQILSEANLGISAAGLLRDAREAGIR